MNASFALRTALCGLLLALAPNAPALLAQTSQSVHNGTVAGPLLVDGTISVTVDEVSAQACPVACPPYSTTVSARLRATLSLQIEATASGPVSTSPCGTVPFDLVCLPPIAFAPIENGGYRYTPLVFLACNLEGEVLAGQRSNVFQTFDIEVSIDAGKVGGVVPTIVSASRSFDVTEPLVPGGGPSELDVSIMASVLFDTINLSTLGALGGPFAVAMSTTRLDAGAANDPWWSAQAEHFVATGYSLGGNLLFPSFPIFESFEIETGCGPWPTACESDRWARGYDQDNFDRSKGLLARPDGGLILAARTGVSSNKSWTSSLDASGNILWQRENTVTVSTTMEVEALAATATGGFLQAGGGAGTASRVEAYDSIGAGLYATQLAPAPATGASGVTVRSVTATADGGALVVGYVTYVAAGLLPAGTYGWLAKLDAAGALQWTRQLAQDAGFEPGQPHTEFADAVELPGGDLLLVGRVKYSDSNTLPLLDGTNAIVVRVEADGDLVYARALGTLLEESFRTVTISAAGQVVAGGRHDFHPLDDSTIKHHAWLATIVPGTGTTSTGAGGWSAVYAGALETSVDEVSDVIAVGPGFVATALTGAGAAGDGWFFQIGTGGAPGFFRAVRGPQDDDLLGVAALPDGFALHGITRSLQPVGTGGAENDMWVLRTGIDGNVGFLPAYGISFQSETALWGPRVEVELSLASLLIDMPLTVTAGTLAHVSSSAGNTLLSN